MQKCKKELDFIMSNLKRLTFDLGKIIIEDDRYICYVEQEKVDSYIKDDKIILPELRDGFRLSSFFEELNKEIYYIFDNIEFRYDVEIRGDWLASPYITFQNCTFYQQLWCRTGYIITFINNTYANVNSIKKEKDRYFISILAYEINFINDNVNVPYYGIFVDAKNIYSINSSIVSRDLTDLKDEIEIKPPANIKIVCNNICLENSRIDANEIYIEFDFSAIFNCKITAKELVKLERERVFYIDDKPENLKIIAALTHSYHSIGLPDEMISEADSIVNIELNNIITGFDIDSPILLFNDKDISSEIEIIKSNIELMRSRKKFIQLLSNLKNICDSVNNDKIDKYKKQLEEKSIVRTLKK